MRHVAWPAGSERQIQDASQTQAQWRRLVHGRVYAGQSAKEAPRPAGRDCVGPRSACTSCSNHHKHWYPCTASYRGHYERCVASVTLSAHLNLGQHVSLCCASTPSHTPGVHGALSPTIAHCPALWFNRADRMLRPSMHLSDPDWFCPTSMLPHAYMLPLQGLATFLLLGRESDLVGSQRHAHSP